MFTVKGLKKTKAKSRSAMDLRSIEEASESNSGYDPEDPIPEYDDHDRHGPSSWEFGRSLKLTIYLNCVKKTLSSPLCMKYSDVNL